MNEFNGIEMFKRAYNIYNRLLNEIAKENNLTLNQLQILMCLEKNNQNNIAKNIVEELGVTKSHVSMSVNNLKNNGYIEKIQDKSDKKISHLKLTKKSINVVEKGKNVKEQVKEIMFKGINKEEIKVLNDVSEKIQKNLKNNN